MEYLKSLQIPAIRTGATTAAIALVSYATNKCATIASYGVSFPVDIYAASGAAALANIVNHVAARLLKSDVVKNNAKPLSECKFTPALFGSLVGVAGYVAYTGEKITKDTGIFYAAIAIATIIANHFPRSGDPKPTAAAAQAETV